MWKESRMGPVGLKHQGGSSNAVGVGLKYLWVSLSHLLEPARGPLPWITRTSCCSTVAHFCAAALVHSPAAVDTHVNPFEGGTG